MVARILPVLFLPLIVPASHAPASHAPCDDSLQDGVLIRVQYVLVLISDDVPPLQGEDVLALFSSS